jgi:hypothetical protein
LISQFKGGRSQYFYPFGTYNNSIALLNNNFYTTNNNFVGSDINWAENRTSFHCYFFDQEPLYDSTIPLLTYSLIGPDRFDSPRHINILANSEKSDFKRQCLKVHNYYNWYYFFHGFAALDWYRDFQYVNTHSFDRFSKVFICYNHLISKYRSYRLHLVSNLIERDLVKHGHVSFFLKDKLGTWQEAVRDPDAPLNNKARVKIYQTLRNVHEPLVIDTLDPHGALSAELPFDDLTDALWHIVTETVYFQPKLHLTEKVFKPIVTQRPFILVAAPGNLAYLKSYGFKTFDQWIDESYDEEQDHYIRIEKITNEIERLCQLSPEKLKAMHNEMKIILQYNYDHFYGDFKNIIVDELVDNFSGILNQINNGRQPNNHSRYHQRFEIDPLYLEEVKKRLK